MSRRYTAHALLSVLTLCVVFPVFAVQETKGALQRFPSRFERGLEPGQLGVIVNERDPASVDIGRYYMRKRRIPVENVIRVAFDPGVSMMPISEFQRIKAHVDGRTPAGVQAFALTWAAPYRVDCMSITSAFAFGFNKAFCANGCKATRLSPYFNSASTAPFDDLVIRPTMALAGETVEDVKRLIDRGIASDGFQPRGTGYFVITDDKARNTRAQFYYDIVNKMGKVFNMSLVKANALENRFDVFFYFTGRARIDKIRTNHFLPGAIADHLTSAGGQLTDSSQMSALRWLEAGATGSYGAVVEPCNFPQKFPHPAVAIFHYLSGDTLIEAYWKSVAWPGQGIFVGEPLARPFAVK